MRTRLIQKWLDKWKTKDKALLIESLSLYISAGLRVTDALDATAANMSVRKKACISRIKTDFEHGRSLSSALKEEVGLPSSTVGLVACGESSGSLGSALASAHYVMERAADMKSRCLSSMAYPALIGLATSALTLGLVRGVIPQIEPLLKGMGTGLPLMTKVVVAFSDAVASYWLQMIAVAAAAATVAAVAYARSEAAHRASQWMLVHIPIAGGAFRRYALSMLLRSLGVLIDNGMPIDTAYSQAVSEVTILGMRSSLLTGLPRVRRGEKLSSIMSAVLPPYASSLISAGEASGAVGQTIIRAADIMDRDLDQTLKRLSSLMEPMMMLVMGGVVGTVAISIMMPIYDISRALQH
ncbi:MAG: type II secretion system F family protein [Patescibacteria group bacterium]|nr:type II secretion system F family protein [Patescibacteria group bacterium]